MGLKPVIEVNWRREVCAWCARTRVQGSRLEAHAAASLACVHARVCVYMQPVMISSSLGRCTSVMRGKRKEEGNVTSLSHVQVWKHGSCVSFVVVVVLCCLLHRFICCHMASHHIHFGGGGWVGLNAQLAKKCNATPCAA